MKTFLKAGFLALAALLSFVADAGEIRQISQLVNASGRPIVNGYIYVGVYNLDPVTNPISLFSDSALTVPIANPQRTDSYGRPVNDIYFAATQYSYTLKDSSSVTVEGPKNRLAVATVNYVNTATSSLQNSSQQWCGTAGGTPNALTCTLTPTLASYTNGLTVRVEIAADNTGAVTLNVDSVGVRNVVKVDGTALIAGDLQQDDIATFTYDVADNRWELQSSNASLTRDGSNINGTFTLSTTVLQGGTPLVAEGATANDFETSVAVTDPTADRTITVPDATGTVLLSTYDSATSTDVMRTIGSGSMNTGGDTTISIPAGAWKELQIIIHGLRADTDFAAYLRPNNDTGNNYDCTLLSLNSGGTTADSVSHTSSSGARLTTSTLWEENDSVVNPIDMYIRVVDPAGSSLRKNMRIEIPSATVAGGSFAMWSGGCRWKNTAAMTSMVVLLRTTGADPPAGSTVNASGGTYEVRGYK